MRTRSTERYDVGSEAETTELFASDSANPQSPRVNSPAGGGATEIFSSNPKTCTRERAIGSSAPSAAQAATCNNTSATASKYFTCRKLNIASAFFVSSRSMAPPTTQVSARLPMRSAARRAIAAADPGAAPTPPLSRAGSSPPGLGRGGTRYKKPRCVSSCASPTELITRSSTTKLHSCAPVRA